MALATPLSKPIFTTCSTATTDARVRLWRTLKTGMDDAIERRVVAYPDLKSPEFAAINPLKKVPAFIRADGTCVFESAVILDYLEDLYADAMPSFKPPTAEGRQLMQLFIRIHDLYSKPRHSPATSRRPARPRLSASNCAAHRLAELLRARLLALARRDVPQ